jgi:hypothetical protein
MMLQQWGTIAMAPEPIGDAKSLWQVANSARVSLPVLSRMPVAAAAAATNQQELCLVT